MDLMNFAMQMIQKNPNVANNPRNKSMLQAIQNGDNTKGEEIANNLLKTYGVSKDQAIQQAKQFFHL